MRNLSDSCKDCKDDHASISMCFDICSVPIDLLEEIEHKRNLIKEGRNKNEETGKEN